MVSMSCLYGSTAQILGVRWPAEMAEVLSAQNGKGLSVKAAFTRDADSPGERPAIRLCPSLKQPGLGKDEGVCGTIAVRKSERLTPLLSS